MANADLPFETSHAFIIGIDNYINTRQLSTAVADALDIKTVLEAHGYLVHEPLLDEAASKENIEKLIREDIPNLIGPKDRLIFYFAGHGIAFDSDVDPRGFLIPVDADLDQQESFVAMSFLKENMDSWECKHGLLIMDCCFAGAFRWAMGLRAIRRRKAKVIYQERFLRYTTDPAWQIITSASADEQAIDVLNKLIGTRPNTGNSPFATALKEGLAGAADFQVLNGKKDGVITATELYVYLRDRVQELTASSPVKQTPAIFNLSKHRSGEYMFVNPDPSIIFNLPPFPDRNPYQGLQSFEEEDAAFFYGREEVIKELETLVENQPMVVITAGSGMGKSSLAKAGLMPSLRLNYKQEEGVEPWNIIVVRPEQQFMQALHLPLPKEDEEIASQEFQKSARLLQLETQKHILVIDQYEQALIHGVTDERYLGFDRALASLLAAEEQRLIAGEESRFRLILTIRSDYELLLHGAEHALTNWWKNSRYVVPNLNWDNLYDIVTLPAQQSILFFEPEDFPAKLVTEVDQQAGALPLLSLTLNSLYKKLVEQDRSDRKLLESDFLAMDGLIGVVRDRADAVFEALGAEQNGAEKQKMMKRIILRMLKIENGKLVRRKVPFLLPGVEKTAASESPVSKENIPQTFNELDFEEDEDDALVHAVRRRLELEQLIIVTPPDEETRQSYLEPMHDALINFWPRCLRWVQEFGPANIVLQRLLWSAVMDYLSRAETSPADVFTDEIVSASFLWDRNPKLDQLGEVLDSDFSWLNKPETDFIRQSLAKRNLIVTQLRRERDEARSSALAARGLLIFPENNTMGLNLAMHALEKARTKDVLNTIFEITSERNALFYRRFAAHSQAVTCAAFTPDGNQLVTGSNDKTAILWTRKGKAIHSFEGHESKILSLAISSDGEWLATGSEDGSIRIWSLKNKQAQPVVIAAAHSRPVMSIAFSPLPIIVDEQDSPSIKLLSGSTDSKVILWDLNGNLVQEFTDPEIFQIWSVAFSPDGQEVLAGTGNKLALLWNLEGTVVRRFIEAGHAHVVTAIAMSKDEHKAYVITGGFDNQGTDDHKVILWNNRELSAKKQQDLIICNKPISGVAFSATGGRLAISCQNGTAYVGNVEGYEPIALRDRGQAFWDIDFSPDGNTLLIAGDKGHFILHDLNGALVNSFPQHKFGFGISPVLFTPAGFSPVEFEIEEEGLFIGSKEGQGVLLNVSGENIQMIVQHDSTIRRAAFSADGQFLVTGGMDGRVKRINFSNQPIWDIQAADPSNLIIEAVAISGDGQTIYSANQSTTIKIWTQASAATGAISVDSTITDIALSKDDKYLLIGTSSGKAYYRNLVEESEIELIGHDVLNGIEVTTVAINNQGDRLLTGARDGKAILWDNTGRKIRELVASEGAVRCVRFSPDDQYILVTCEDALANIWDSEGGRLQELIIDAGHVWSGDFSSDGKWVALKAIDESVLLFRNYMACWEQGEIERLTVEEERYFGVAEPRLMINPA